MIRRWLLLSLTVHSPLMHNIRPSNMNRATKKQWYEILQSGPIEFVLILEYYFHNGSLVNWLISVNSTRINLPQSDLQKLRKTFLLKDKWFPLVQFEIFFWNWKCFYLKKRSFVSAQEKRKVNRGILGPINSSFCSCSGRSLVTVHSSEHYQYSTAHPLKHWLFYGG